MSAAEQAMARADVSDFVAVDDALASLSWSWDAVHQHMAALLTMAERNAVSPPPSLSQFGSAPAFLGG